MYFVLEIQRLRINPISPIHYDKLRNFVYTVDRDIENAYRRS